MYIARQETCSFYPRNEGTSASIDALYHDKEELEVNKQFVRENDKKTLAQVFTDVRYTKANNEYFSDVLLKVLKGQGFL